MSIGSGLAFLSIPAAIAAIGLLFEGDGTMVGAIIIGCVGFVQVAKVIKAIEFNKNRPGSNRSML